MRFIIKFLLVFAVACDGSSDQKKAAPENKSEDQALGNAPAPPAPVVAEQPETPTQQGPNSQIPEEILLELDARSTLEAVYFKVENGSLARSTADEVWVFSVKRTQFQTNSGTSGALNFGALSMNTSDFASVSECQDGALTYDTMLPASGAPGSQPYSGNALLNSWYDYNPTTHAVSSKKLVYLLSSDTTCLKFQIESYESGLYKVRAKLLAGPASIPPPNPTPTPAPTPTPEPPAPGLTIDASSSTGFVPLKWEDGKLIPGSLDQPWLIAVKRSQFQSNSGTSGTGQVGVMSLETTDYQSVTECKNGTLTHDEMLPASGAPGSQPYSGNALLNSWYNYDATTHQLNSKKIVYLLRDDRRCLKFQILSYASGVYKVLADELQIPAPEPLVFEQSIDASSTLAPIYLKLEQGQLVSTTQDQAWIFSIKRTQFQTNSGTSGSGSVGVHNTETTDFAALNSCENLAYTFDEMLPASGAPGSQPTSGSAVLNAWYSYDMTTHSVSSKKFLYLLSDGTTCLKLQILGYTSGVYTLKVSQL